MNGARANRFAKVKELADQLRWSDEAGLKRYEALKSEVTQQLLGKIDLFISESFQADSATPEQVKAGLDALLGRRGDESEHNVAFAADLAGGRFLIVGVELRRGGTAINDDWFSFRAYTDSGNRFALVATEDDLSGSAGVDLHAEVLPASPLPAEIWFFALAEQPPQAPPTVAIRLYAFNGKAFRTVWAPGDILALSVRKAVQITPDGGFVVNRLSDPTGHAARAPNAVIHDQYALAPDGPQKVATWTTGIQ